MTTRIFIGGPLDGQRMALPEGQESFDVAIASSFTPSREDSMVPSTGPRAATHRYFKRVLATGNVDASLVVDTMIFEGFSMELAQQRMGHALSIAMMVLAPGSARK